MIYQPRVNTVRFKRKRFVFAGVALLVLLFILFEFTSLRASVTSLFHIITLPLSKIESVATNEVVSVVSSKRSLLREIENLKTNIEETNVLLHNAEEIKKENELLKETLGRSGGEHLLLGYVLAKPNRSPYDTMLVDVGEEEGVRVGMRVRAYGESPIGMVAETFPKTALIRLFSSPHQETSVVIGEKQIPGVAIGIGGGNFRMLLPRDATVSLGDTIFLPGEETRILGIVERIDKYEGDTFAKIFFKSIVNPYDLSRVFIVIEE